MEWEIAELENAHQKMGFKSSKLFEKYQNCICGLCLETYGKHSAIGDFCPQHFDSTGRVTRFHSKDKFTPDPKDEVEKIMKNMGYAYDNKRSEHTTSSF